MKHIRNCCLVATTILLLQRISAFSTLNKFFAPLIKQRRETDATAVISKPLQATNSAQDIAIVLLPGCMVDPQQYNQLAKSINEHSQQNVWVAVPKVALGMVNPLTAPNAVHQAVQALRDQGYKGKDIYLGGHSLGGAFLSDVVAKDLNEDIAGLVYLGAFEKRQSDLPKAMPRLTVCGELDGLMRTSRIAEAYHQSIVRDSGNQVTNELQKPVVLVQGMNHFQFLEGKPHIMKKHRDLLPDITDQEALAAVSSTIAQFLDFHSASASTEKAKAALLRKVRSTGDYVQPLLNAMALEGRIGVGNQSSGSAWSERIQKEILKGVAGLGNQDKVMDEFHTCWSVQADFDRPVFYPQVSVDRATNRLEIETISQPVYEPLGELLDTGFFSQAATEIRAKFNSPKAVSQAIAKRDGSQDDQPDIVLENIAGIMNNHTIQWALKQAPEPVRRRYLERGIQLVAGKDIRHNNGPAWIWSGLQYRRRFHKDTGKEVVVVHSHTMSTPIDHFIPGVRGKLYMKLLSPAKVLDWMYTDSMRPPRTIPVPIFATEILRSVCTQ